MESIEGDIGLKLADYVLVRSIDDKSIAYSKSNHLIPLIVQSN